jgi:hypothetical protein
MERCLGGDGSSLADAEGHRALAGLSGGLGTPEAINQLIERIQQEGEL